MEAWPPGRDGRGGGGGCRAPRGAETGLSRTRRGCWEAPTPRALAVPRLLSPEKVPAGQGKKALARLTWGRPTCCKAWDPGCQRILTAAGSAAPGTSVFSTPHRLHPGRVAGAGRGGRTSSGEPGSQTQEARGRFGPVLADTHSSCGGGRGLCAWGAVRGVRSGPVWLGGGPACLRPGGKAPSSGVRRKGP